MYKKEAGVFQPLFLLEYLSLRSLILTIFLLGLFSCASENQVTKNNNGPGSIITGKSEQGISLSKVVGLSDKKSGVGLPINALLWRASLDVMSTIPLDDVDTFGGTIVTDWYQLNETSNERIKITVFVLDRELRSDGIRVVVHVQNRENNNWKNIGTDSELSNQLEELILTRAREIRASRIVETNN